MSDAELAVQSVYDSLCREQAAQSSARAARADRADRADRFPGSAAAAGDVVPPRTGWRRWCRRLYLAPVLVALACAALVGEYGCIHRARSAPAPKPKAVKPLSIAPGKWSLTWGAGCSPTPMELDARGGYRWGGDGWSWVGSYGWREDSRTLLVSERMASATEYVTWWVTLDRDGAGITRSDTPWANGVAVRVAAGWPKPAAKVEVVD